MFQILELELESHVFLAEFLDFFLVEIAFRVLHQIHIGEGQLRLFLRALFVGEVVYRLGLDYLLFVEAELFHSIVGHGRQLREGQVSFVFIRLLFKARNVREVEVLVFPLWNVLCFGLGLMFGLRFFYVGADLHPQLL